MDPLFPNRAKFVVVAPSLFPVAAEPLLHPPRKPASSAASATPTVTAAPASSSAAQTSAAAEPTSAAEASAVPSSPAAAPTAAPSSPAAGAEKKYTIAEFIAFLEEADSADASSKSRRHARAFRLF